MTIKTFKYKSRFVTAASFLIVLLASVTVETWQSVLPHDYWVLIPTLISVLGYLATQLTEERRVATAEQMVVEKTNKILGQPLTNDEYVEPLSPVSDVDDGGDGC